jgi:hypothetical protein
MTQFENPNPFELLRLDPTASNDEVVAQAGRLKQQGVNDRELTAIRQAVQILTGSSKERFVQAMFSHPDPCYHWPALERLRAAFRRPPQGTGEQTSRCSPLKLEEFAEMLRPILGEPWDVEKLPDLPRETGNTPGLPENCGWRTLVDDFPG